MIEAIRGGTRLRLLIQPKSSKSEIVGPHDGALKVRIAAPPIEGRANEELVEFLSDLLKIPKRDVVIAKGDTGRRKTVEILGLTPEQIKAKLLL